MQLSDIIKRTKDQSVAVLLYTSVGYKAATSELMEKYGITTLHELPEGELKDFLLRLRDYAEQAIELDFER